jgi:diguanylate cyclase (GGDEF)-like protein/PAS domain S-box-containing protein
MTDRDRRAIHSGGTGSDAEPGAGAERSDDLRAREAELLRVVLDFTDDTIVRFDRQLRYDYVNERTIDVVGLPREEWMGRTAGELGLLGPQVEEFERRLLQVFRSGRPMTYEDDWTDETGPHWSEANLYPQRDEDGQVAHVVVVSRDITDRKLAEAELVRAAHNDPLTGLANRAALVEEIDRAIAGGGRSGSCTAVLLIDLDHFKLVNDALGHAIGDDVLTMAARRIESCARGGDLVARHGGDEFVVVMRDVASPSDPVLLARRIVEAFHQPLVDGSTTLSNTASIGVSLTKAGEPRKDAHDLIREADTAMYAAKSSGRDGVAVFDAKLHLAIDERLRIGNDLRGALDRDELVLWYQPEIDLRTGAIVAVEALLRWDHPSGERYPAARFIDVATESGLIVDIGRWSLGQVCADAQEWGDPVTIRLNLAPRQLADPSLLVDFDRALSSIDCERAPLCVEITETAFLQDSEVVSRNLAGLSDRGVLIAIDDFGTGFASLTYLRRYHVDVVKIDRSFISDIATSDRDRRLTAAIVALARRLDMTVTAEGVETDAQEAVVREIGCDGAQGFRFSPAVPPDELAAVLTAQPWRR